MDPRPPTLPATARPRPMLAPAAFDHLLGGLRSGGIGSLPVSLLYFQLNAFLANPRHGVRAEIRDIPRLLLEHNASPRRRREISEMLPIDADLVFERDAASGATSIDWKPYFLNPGFERPQGHRRVVLHVHVTEADGMRRTVSVPLQALMAGYGDVNEGHQGYAHTIAFLDAAGSPIEEWFYLGVSSRNWLVRMEEHMREIRSGSGKRFHAAWRAYAGDSRVMLNSELIVLNHSFAGIMGWEEQQVDAHMAAGNSLNMIPGGFKGMRFLHEHRVTRRARMSLDERDKAIEAYVRREGIRPSLPNPFLARLWEDDAFYLKVLAGRSDVLVPAQVLEIRRLSAGGTDEAAIAVAVGARNVEQVRRVLAGKTYRRVT